MQFVKKDKPLKAINLAGLNKNEKRMPNPYFDVYHVRALVCGSTGSGKTTFVLNYLFHYLNYYRVIIYMAPSETFDSGYLKTIKDDKKLSAKFIFLDIRKEKLPTISELQKVAKHDNKICLILDDFINVLTSKEDRKQIDAYLTQSSRANCDLFLLCQTYNHITPSIATNINVMILFTKYMSRDSFNTCIRRSFTGEFTKELGDFIYDVLRHAYPHQPFIFINDQPENKSILYNDNYIIKVDGNDNKNDHVQLNKTYGSSSDEDDSYDEDNYKSKK